ncbi:hydantoinase/oxoprolinase N-terminal domain-containing protein [Salinithrix halophila]|uniref:Hydantoinase/oxoprolinase N-terminal domain-containing protein n=1 Tax=Salinithrix halophila TaxID=1485204 RepID=A0ABV8JAY5_9BACL
MRSFRIGVDVGGTHTDAVLLDDRLTCVYQVKVPTTEDVDGGIAAAVRRLMRESGVKPGRVKVAMLGTTHCTNAIVERKQLLRVGVIRIGAPATLSVPPMTGWPEDLKRAVGGQSFIVQGGREFDGRPIVPLDGEEIRAVCSQFQGVDAVAITGVFSPAMGEDEEKAAQIVKEELGRDFPLTLSHQLAGLGLLERENAAILNASLTGVIQSVVAGFRDALHGEDIRDARVFFGQNDGTLMTLESALHYPIRMIACGPTHSVRGAAHLAGVTEGLVVDVGGTTTDIGALTAGFPRESASPVEIGGIRTLFRMPDLLSIGIGGGTVLHRDQTASVRLGPDSVGSRLFDEGRCFGGRTWTLTDAAAVVGRVRWAPSPPPSREEHKFCEQAYAKMVAAIEEGIDRMKGRAGAVPVLLVGGGSALLPDRLQGVNQVIRPPHHDVANAIGAALGEVGGQIDTIVSIKEDRRDLLDELKEQAVALAVREGADSEKVRVVETEEVPLAYLPGRTVRVRIKAAGPLVS